jgi:LmbE family N-acetylglucosaminyl deacetylase
VPLWVSECVFWMLIRKLSTSIAIFLLLATGGVSRQAAKNASATSDPTPLPTLASPVASDRILVVAPHPDDETIGAGGYLMEAVQAGARVQIVVATDGRMRGTKEIRYQEIRNAVAKLGVSKNDITFLGYPDGELSSQASFQDRLEAICADFHPNIVIGTHPKDYHPDHAAVGRAIDSLGRSSKRKLTAYFFVVHYHHYPLPDAYRPEVLEVPANRLVDKVSTWESLPLSDKVEQAKCAAVLEYHSQILKKNPLKRGLLISFIRKNEVFAVRSY